MVQRFSEVHLKLQQKYLTILSELSWYFRLVLNTSNRLSLTLDAMMQIIN